MTRLEALAAAIPADSACVADVGHDHGLLLASLLRSRTRIRVVGVELRADADTDFAVRFAQEIRGWGERVSLRRGDAFEVLQAGEADTVVMAGFGERAMLEALDRGAALGRLPARLVLCPANFEVALRPGLLERGWRFVSESLVEDAGRFFEILSVAREGEAPANESERRWGPFILRGPDPLLAPYLRDTARRQSEALASARVRPDGSPLLAKLALFDEVTRRCPSWEHPET
jgi:tRNA (adenine22-N1)-methyltransferase